MAASAVRNLTVLWLAAHLPHLGLEIFQQRQPQSPLPPMALTENGRVYLACPRALDAGVSVGCALATALSIVPELRHCERDEAAEIQRLQTLASMAYGFTPSVSLVPPTALLLEVRGSLRLFEGLGPLLRRLSQAIRRLGHRASLAAAHTSAAALALAKAGLATPLADFPDQAELRRRTLQAMAAVPLPCTEIDARSIERLADMGIFRVGPLAELPRHELGKRFGADLLETLGKLMGDLADPQRPEPPKERFRASLHLLESASSKQALRSPMACLAARLEAWLSARQLGAGALIWRFKPLAGGSLALPVRFAKPRLQAPAFLDISDLALERADLPAEVMTVALTADRLAPVSQSAHSGRDLLPNAAAAAEAPADFVDRLAARLGGDSLRLLRLVDDHRPERAAHCVQSTASGPVSLAARRGAKVASVLGSPVGSGERPARPLWLLESPQPVRLKDYRILSGPERIASGWWGRRSLSRDYFVAQRGDGARCWLFRRHKPLGLNCGAGGWPANEPGGAAEAWFLHGYFA